MQRILLTVLLATAFSTFVSIPATAIGEKDSEQQQTANKTENVKSHRQQHREQVLNK